MKNNSHKKPDIIELNLVIVFQKIALIENVVRLSITNSKVVISGILKLLELQKIAWGLILAT